MVIYIYHDLVTIYYNIFAVSSVGSKGRCSSLEHLDRSFHFENENLGNHILILSSLSCSSSTLFFNLYFLNLHSSIFRSVFTSLYLTSLSACDLSRSRLQSTQIPLLKNMPPRKSTTGKLQPKPIAKPIAKPTAKPVELVATATTTSSLSSSSIPASQCSKGALSLNPPTALPSRPKPLDAEYSKSQISLALTCLKTKPSDVDTGGIAEHAFCSQ